MKRSSALQRQTLDTPTEEPSYKRLTDADRLLILHLFDKQWTYEAIAQHLTRSISTIHEVVQTYSPTIDLAKRRLHGAALKLAESVIKDGKPSDHVNVLKGIGVLQDAVNTGVSISIGGAGDVKVNILTLQQTASSASE